MVSIRPPKLRVPKPKIPKIPRQLQLKKFQPRAKPLSATMVERSWWNLFSNATEQAFEEMGQEIVEHIRNVILTQSPPAGIHWPPLSPVTVRKKGHSMILYDTGALVDSFKYEVFKSGRYVYLKIFTTIPYAPIHEFGGYTGRNLSTYIPARPFFFPTIHDYMVEHFGPQWQELFIVKHFGPRGQELQGESEIE